MDRRVLCESLIKWMKTLNLNRTIHGAGDLSDGVSIGICLKTIDTNHFNDLWLQKIRIDTGDNYRLKANNLKKILKYITDYYSEMLRFLLSKQTNYLRCTNVILQRFLSTKTTAVPVGTGLSTVQASDNLPILYIPSLMSRIKMKFGLQGELREPQKVLYQAAAISYYMIGSSVDFDAIHRELDMPDVFASFGRIVFLHIWFLLVRYVQLGPTGVFLRRQLARTMWVDLDLRAQQILPGQAKTRRSQLEELRSEMNAFMLALDEGLVDDDTVLAAAIWRHFCHFQPTPLERLITMVTYIRKNIRHLEQLPDENFMKNGYIYFLPLHGDTVDTKFVNRHYLDFKNKAQGALKK